MGTRSGASLAYGYPFHESCWSILTDCWSPCDREIQLLFDLCRSTPLDPKDPWPSNQAILDWGHAYGGVFEYSLETEEVTHGVLSGSNFRIASRTGFDPLRHDPELTLAIQDTLRNPNTTLNQRRTSLRQKIRRDNLRTLPKDVFHQLPVEIRQLILESLTLSGAFALRQASRSFAELGFHD